MGTSIAAPKGFGCCRGGRNLFRKGRRESSFRLAWCGIVSVNECKIVWVYRELFAFAIFCAHVYSSEYVDVRGWRSRLHLLTVTKSSGIPGQGRTDPHNQRLQL